MALSVIFTATGTLRHANGATYTPTATQGAVSVPISLARGMFPQLNQPAAFFCFTGTTSDRPSASTAATGNLNIGQEPISNTVPVIPGAIAVPSLSAFKFGLPFYDTTLSKMITFCGFQATSTGWCDQSGASA